MIRTLWRWVPDRVLMVVTDSSYARRLRVVGLCCWLERARDHGQADCGWMQPSLILHQSAKGHQRATLAQGGTPADTRPAPGQSEDAVADAHRFLVWGQKNVSVLLS